MAGYRIDDQLSAFGEHVHGWRMVLGPPAQQVAERAGTGWTREIMLFAELLESFTHVNLPFLSRPMRRCKYGLADI